MRTKLIAGALTIILTSLPAAAFNQPTLNLGLTSMFDGGPTESGFYLVEYVHYARATKPKDHNGTEILGGAEVAALVNLNQFLYISDYKLWGGRLGANFVLPMVGTSAKGNFGPIPFSANTGGLGDIFLGVNMLWDGTLLGRPFHSYVELDFGLPTGKYDANFAVNAGANHSTFNPYYSFTWLFSEKWETSWQYYYAYHGKNSKTDTRPGQVFHSTYEISRALHPQFRLGVGGYFLQQLTEDKIGGVSQTDSKERAFAVGPTFAYMSEGYILVASHFSSIYDRNRFSSQQTTLQIIHKF